MITVNVREAKTHLSKLLTRVMSGEQIIPLDRLLIFQSQLENISLLTGDVAITRYDVGILW